MSWNDWQLAWTPEDDERLRLAWDATPRQVSHQAFWRAVHERFAVPARSVDAVRHRAEVLGLQVKAERGKGGRPRLPAWVVDTARQMRETGYSWHEVATLFRHRAIPHPHGLRWTVEGLRKAVARARSQGAP